MSQIEGSAVLDIRDLVSQPEDREDIRQLLYDGFLKSNPSKVCNWFRHAFVKRALT